MSYGAPDLSGDRHHPQAVIYIKESDDEDVVIFVPAPTRAPSPEPDLAAGPDSNAQPTEEDKWGACGRRRGWRMRPLPPPRHAHAAAAANAEPARAAAAQLAFELKQEDEGSAVRGVQPLPPRAPAADRAPMRPESHAAAPAQRQAGVREPGPAWDGAGRPARIQVDRELPSLNRPEPLERREMMTLGRCESEEAGPPLAPVHQARVQPPAPVRGAAVAEADVQRPLAHPQLHRQAEPDAQRPASAAAAAAATAATAAKELPAAQHRRANSRHMPVPTGLAQPYPHQRAEPDAQELASAAPAAAAELPLQQQRAPPPTGPTQPRAATGDGPAQPAPERQQPAQPASSSSAAAATVATAMADFPAAQHRRADARHMPAARFVADVSAAPPQPERPREPLPHPASGARPAGEAPPLVAQQPLAPLATHELWAAFDADVERRWRERRRRERRPGEDVIHWAASQVALLNNRPAHVPAPSRPLPAASAERSGLSEQAADLTTAARSAQPPPAQCSPAPVAEQPRLPEQAASTLQAQFPLHEHQWPRP